MTRLDDLGDKILKGAQLAVDRMIDQAIKNDEEIVIAGKDGKVMHVKARDLKK